MIDPDGAARFEGMPAAEPRQVVGELEHLVAVGVRTLRAVTETAESRDADARNSPCLRRVG